MKQLLTGNEAFARGAYEAGVRFASAYPGTPSTEILENLTKYSDITSEWAPNEKVALEAVIGASLAGVRSIASMKHVGVNVAADPLFTVSYTGVNGGLVLISADEPGQHSSQNEQDNRLYAEMAKIPMLEPSNSSECHDMVKEAFEISEKFDTPVMLRTTTRVCHSKSVVDMGERSGDSPKPYVKNALKYVMVPAFAQKRRVVVENRMKELRSETENSRFNKIEEGGKIGVICSGMCYHFAREVFGDDATYLKLGFTNPLPDKLLAEFYKKVDTVYVIEENDPYIENWVKRNGFECKGKDVFPPYGEMTPDVIRKSVFGKALAQTEFDQSLVVPRPPALCAGCPHRGVFYDLGKRKNVAIAGDIGCYALGFAEPYNGMDSIICMGAAFSMAHGMAKAFKSAGSDMRAIGIMGDSTFFHTGINSLEECVYNGSNAVCIILDNRITGMTGHQENPGTGKLANGEPAVMIDIEAVVRALGVKNVAVINPNELKEVKDAIDTALKCDELSVIITKWPCVLKRMDSAELSEYGNPFKQKCVVDTEGCVACKACLRSGCPAIAISPETGKSLIDQSLCVGCGVCGQICPKNAISFKEGK